MNDDLRPQAHAARILVVDDVPANVLLLANLLRQQGYTNVQTTTDPRVVAGWHELEPYELILLDLQMPHCDGFAVMDRLKRGLKGDFLPVIVVTAYAEADARLRALKQGARDYITKPFVAAEVAQRVHNHLEVRMLYRERKHQAEVLEQKVRERTRELSDTQKEILRRLAIAGEYRDNETGNHVARVSHGCRLLAHAAGLSEETAEMLLYASPMHDIGKIGVPDGVLLKPGALDPAEAAIMRRHVEIGAQMLGNHPAPVLRMAHRIALYHHEKWDGTGYARGVAGEQIPVEARIVAICDVFDALTSARPYKSAWTIEAAVDHVRSQAGKHFDSRLVQVFFEVLPELLRIRQRFSDPAGTPREMGYDEMRP